MSLRRGPTNKSLQLTKPAPTHLYSSVRGSGLVRLCTFVFNRAKSWSGYSIKVVFREEYLVSDPQTTPMIGFPMPRALHLNGFTGIQPEAPAQFSETGGTRGALLTELPNTELGDLSNSCNLRLNAQRPERVSSPHPMSCVWASGIQPRRFVYLLRRPFDVPGRRHRRRYSIAYPARSTWHGLASQDTLSSHVHPNDSCPSTRNEPGICLGSQPRRPNSFQLIRLVCRNTRWALLRPAVVSQYHLYLA